MWNISHKRNTITNILIEMMLAPMVKGTFNNFYFFTLNFYKKKFNFFSQLHTHIQFCFLWLYNFSFSEGYFFFWLPFLFIQLNYKTKKIYVSLIQSQLLAIWRLFFTKFCQLQQNDLSAACALFVVLSYFNSSVLLLEIENFVLPTSTKKKKRKCKKLA